MKNEKTSDTKICSSDGKNRFILKWTMNRALVIVLLLFFCTAILAQDYKEDDQNNSYKSTTSLIVRRIPLQNYRRNEMDLKHSKPKMKKSPRQNHFTNGYIIFISRSFGNSFSIILLTCLIINNHKTIDRIIIMKIR